MTGTHPTIRNDAIVASLAAQPCRQLTKATIAAFEMDPLGSCAVAELAEAVHRLCGERAGLRRLLPVACGC